MRARVAQVLRQQGVEVSVAHDQDELLSARVDTDTTVVVTSTEQLAGSTTSRLERKARTAGTLVIVAPPPEVADDLGGGLQIAGSRSGRAAASCDDPLLDGLTLDVKDSPAYFAPGSERCFPVNDGGLVLDLRVVPQTYVVGAADLLRNERIHEGDNAAAALRLLGQHPRVGLVRPRPRPTCAATRAARSPACCRTGSLRHWSCWPARPSA